MICEILSASLPDVMEYFSSVLKIKKSFSGNSIETCAIVNAKSGKCFSDCKFCAQSKYSKAKIDIYPLLDIGKLLSIAKESFNKGIDRFSFVCSGVALSNSEIKYLGKVVETLKAGNSELRVCVSLGQIKKEELLFLKACGVDRYHHNLETSREFYPFISSVQAWEDRFRTVAIAKEIGLSVCSGGIFGLGESDEDIVSLFSSLKELEVDSVPLNFFHPVKGIPLEKQNFLTPLRSLQIVFAARAFFNKTVIRICGGREYNLRELQPFAVSVVDGLMVGNYLTTKGRTLMTDLELLKDLALDNSLNLLGCSENAL